jgi:hypothetical protein
LTEEQAVKRHGADAIETFLWQWTTLEVQAAHRLKHPSVRENEIDYVPANCMCKVSSTPLFLPISSSLQFKERSTRVSHASFSPPQN